jgi:hypothetical protein
LPHPTPYRPIMTHDKVRLFDTEGFKARLLSLRKFPRGRKEELLSSDASEAHIKLGMVPEHMTQKGFRDIIKLKKLGFDEEYGLPLLPAIQNSWTGRQVAEWLVQSKMVDRSRRSTISKNMDGNRFRQGHVHDVLTKEEIKKVNSRLKRRIEYVAISMWAWSGTSSEQRAAVGSLFNIDFKKISSFGDLVSELKQRYSLTLEEQPTNGHLSGDDVAESVQLAFRHEYSLKEDPKGTFLDHVIELRKDRCEYFAPYTFLGQSGGMGKSLLPFATLENEENVVLPFMIDCSRYNEKGATGKLIRFIMELKTQEEMSRLFCCLLSLVIGRQQDKEGFVKETENLSRSLEDLGITFEKVKSMYDSIKSEAAVNNKFEEIGKLVERMKLKRRRSNGVKKVIPIVVFDEASILSKNTFEFETFFGPSDLEILRSQIFDTVRLIRRVLNLYKDLLGLCPVVFADAKTTIASFIPTSLGLIDYGQPHRDNMGCSGPSKLFREYMLTGTFNAFARRKPHQQETRLVGNWYIYIPSLLYPYHL